MHNLASTLRDQGDHAGAQQLHERVLETMRRVLGDEHPDTLISMNNLANTLSIRGDHSGAQGLREHVMEAMRHMLGEEHPDTLASMINLAGTLMNRGDYARARELQEEAVEATRRRLGVEHPRTTVAAWGLLQNYIIQRDAVSSDRVISESLLWLLQRDPDSLAGHQRQIRTELEQMIAGSSSEDEITDTEKR